MFTKRLITITSMNILILFSTGSWAAGFAIIEQGVSGLGNAYAGGSAAAEDASTVFFNPAGMTRMGDEEIVAALHYIIPSAKFRDNGSSQDVLGNPLSGGNGGEGGESAFVPNFYYVRLLNNDMHFGLGINAPFGLSTKYNSDWKGRYHGIESSLASININPSLAGKWADNFSWGAGLSIQYVDATLTNAVDAGLVCQVSFGGCGIGATAQNNDVIAKVTGDSVGAGFNFGFLWQITKETRLGLAYRSKIDHSLEGRGTFSGANAAGSTALGIIQGASNQLVNSDVKADVTLPAFLSMSMFTELNPRWSLMGDITYTYWNELDKLVIKFNDGATPDTTETFNWQRNMRFSWGMNYKPTSDTTWRTGFGFDWTAVPDDDRGVRVPGEDRAWMTVGYGYQPKDGPGFDVAYARLKVRDAGINNTNSSGHTLSGAYKARVDIFSAQIRWQF